MNIFLFICCLFLYFFSCDEKEGRAKYVCTFLVFVIPFGSYNFILKPNWAEKDQLEMELNLMEEKKVEDNRELYEKTYENEIAKRIISYYRDKNIDFTNYSSTIKNLRSDVKNYYICMRCEVDSSIVYLDDVGSYVVFNDEYKFGEKYKSQAIFIELHSMKFQWKEQEIYYEDYEGGG
ncbi:hypothetical protein N8Z19_02490 [Saprospiraceae bacterium]|nr:hypothetical protein [Saprospiraceae bacterium]